METLFEAARVREFKDRIERLKSDSPRLWGRMTVAQALAHCASALEVAVGDRHAPRLFLGRIIGRIVKPMALKDGEPMRRNSPTSKDLLVRDGRDFSAEKRRLVQLIDRFAAAGPAGCTKSPHSFFGPMTPDEWSKLMHKHLDHHLRQFGV